MGLHSLVPQTKSCGTQKKKKERRRRRKNPYIFLILDLVRETISKYFLPFCALSFHLLVLWSTKLFNFNDGLPRWRSGTLRIYLPMQKMQVRSLGREDPQEEEMATHSIFLPGKSHGQSLVGYSLWVAKIWTVLSTDAHTHTHNSLVGCALGVRAKKPLPNPSSRRLTLVFF